MLDWLGSLRVEHRSDARIELGITRRTRWAGWLTGGAGVWLATLGHAALVIGGAVVIAGALLATMRRSLVFDRDDGLLRIDQRVLGFGRRSAVPLFHLRSIVVAARGSHFVAYVQRRIGGAIHLDEARHAAPLLALAAAIERATGLRVESDVDSATA